MAACADEPRRTEAEPAMPSHPAPEQRPFGRAAKDLEFDFNSTDRPGLVTALLAACSAPADAEHWWQRPVSERTAALLTVLRAGQGGEVIEHRLHCDQPGCGERFDVELPYAALSLGPVPHHIELARDNAPPLRLRLPTGADLRAWRGQLRNDRSAPGDAQRAMLSRLCLADELRPEDSACAAAALAQVDPLVAFSVTTHCPACGVEADFAVDLEALALQRLQVQQRQLLHDVHVLASRYGWSEAEVMALSPTRRARYVDLIEETA